MLLGHSKIENTVRYLAVDVEEALLLAERTEIQGLAAKDRDSACHTPQFLRTTLAVLRGVDPPESRLCAVYAGRVDDTSRVDAYAP